MGVSMSKTHEKHIKSKYGFIEDQREFFDELIKNDWNTYISSAWDRARQHEVKSILNMIPVPQTVLDIGCGCGFHDLVFAENASIEKIVGIDYSEQSIIKANFEYYNPKIKRFVADIFDDIHLGLIKEEGPFNLICSFQVIEHLSKPVDFIKRCKYLVENGGFIAIVTPNYNRLQNVANKLLGKPVKLIDPLHFAEYSIRNIKDMGSECGLEEYGCFGHGISLSLDRHIIIHGERAVDRFLEKKMTNYNNIIGVIFRKGIM